MSNANDNMSRHWTYGYNNSSTTKNFYIHFKFRSGDKGVIMVSVLGTNTDKGCLLMVVPAAGDISTSLADGKLSTIKEFAGGRGYNGTKISRNSSGEYEFVLTNVEPYAIVEAQSANCELITSYYLNT